jgi:hypothetical protein
MRVVVETPKGLIETVNVLSARFIADEGFCIEIHDGAKKDMIDVTLPVGHEAILEQVLLSSPQNKRLIVHNGGA